MTDRLDTLRALMSCLRGQPPAACDWNKVIALANRTLVTPALAASLADAADVPPEVRSFLSEIEARSIERNRRLHDQMGEALGALNRVGIIPIAMKGTAMLASNPDRFSRLMSDIDLIVPPPEMEKALSCLGALRYQSQSKTNVWGTHSLGRACDTGMIDLHDRVQIKSPDLRYEALAPQCESIGMGDAAVLVPPIAYQCLILILHDQIQEHDYYRGDIDLRHLIDLRDLTGQGSFDWQEVEKLVDGRYLRSALKVQVGTFVELTGKGGPAPALSAWETFQIRRRLWQARFPILKVPLTLVTILADPPVDEFFKDTGSGITGILRKLYLPFKLSRYMVFSRTLASKA
jgi:hypothetical protein